MPTYSYECTKCQNVDDVFHAMSATPKVKCSACGGRTHRLMGKGAGLIFKGSGFYETDFKEKKGKPDKAAESAAPAEGAKAESTSEAKTETKATPKESPKESKPKSEAKTPSKSAAKAATPGKAPGPKK